MGFDRRMPRALIRPDRYRRFRSDRYFIKRGFRDMGVWFGEGEIAAVILASSEKEITSKLLIWLT